MGHWELTTLGSAFTSLGKVGTAWENGYTVANGNGRTHDTHLSSWIFILRFGFYFQVLCLIFFFFFSLMVLAALSLFQPLFYD